MKNEHFCFCYIILYLEQGLVHSGYSNICFKNAWIKLEGMALKYTYVRVISKVEWELE